MRKSVESKSSRTFSSTKETFGTQCVDLRDDHAIACDHSEKRCAAWTSLCMTPTTRNVWVKGMKTVIDRRFTLIAREPPIPAPVQSTASRAMQHLTIT
jgi:hypothetical protein